MNIQVMCVYIPRTLSNSLLVHSLKQSWSFSQAAPAAPSPTDRHNFYA